MLRPPPTEVVDIEPLVECCPLEDISDRASGRGINAGWLSNSAT